MGSEMCIRDRAGGTSNMSLNINDVVELARRVRRNGRPAIEDPWVRQELVSFITEARSNQLMAERAAVPALASDWPTATSMSGKLRGSELNRRMCQFALALRGSNAVRFVCDEAVDGGLWQRSYFNAFSATIGGGTSQIQKNIIGERVLGLDKD